MKKLRLIQGKRNRNLWYIIDHLGRIVNPHVEVKSHHITHRRINRLIARKFPRSAPRNMWTRFVQWLKSLLSKLSLIFTPKYKGER
jgi:hypothetical protein